jgi:peptide/nickel transport system permease protein
MDSTVEGVGPNRSGRARLLATKRPLSWAGLLGIGIVAAMFLIALAAPLLPLPAPDKIQASQRLLTPFSSGHPLGTDQFGRDILSRFIWGARVSLTVGVLCTFAATLLGLLIGVVAGYVGGRAETILMRIVDVIFAFPFLILAITIVGLIGPGIVNAALAIIIVGIPYYARMTHGLTLSILGQPYIDASRSIGTPPRRLVSLHVLPNLYRPLIAIATVDVGFRIIATAGLSFIGLGTQPPAADWGTMLADGYGVISVAPWVATVPGIGIAMVVLGFNLTGDALRDRLDPRVRAQAR